MMEVLTVALDELEALHNTGVEVDASVPSPPSEQVLQRNYIHLNHVVSTRTLEPTVDNII
jgi:hypothetical protein